MADQTTGKLSGTKAGERVDPCINDQNIKTKKNKGGRPKGSKNRAKAPSLLSRDDPTGELAAVDKKAKDKQRIINRQRKDCERLSEVLKSKAEDLKGKPANQIDAKDVTALARSTVQLHQMEQDAYDFGAQGASIAAVILMPMRAESMEVWQAQAKAAAERATTPAGHRGPRLEAEVIGQPDGEDNGGEEGS